MVGDDYGRGHKQWLHFKGKPNKNCGLICCGMSRTNRIKIGS